MYYSAKIKIPAKKIAKFNKLLSRRGKDGLVEALGYPTDEMLECYTAHFSNGWDADIKMCAGDTNFFVDPVLFDADGNERAVLDCGDEYDGDYTFEVDGDTYKVRVEGVAEPCVFLYTETAEGTIRHDTGRYDEKRLREGLSAPKVFKREEDAYAYLDERRIALECMYLAYDYVEDGRLWRGSVIDDFRVLARLEPITVQ